jgi:hypothetical protein
MSSDWLLLFTFNFGRVHLFCLLWYSIGYHFCKGLILIKRENNALLTVLHKITCSGSPTYVHDYSVNYHLREQRAHRSSSRASRSTLLFWLHSVGLGTDVAGRCERKGG